VKVFGRRPYGGWDTDGGRRPKTSRDETREGTYWAVPRAQLWGFGRGGPHLNRRSGRVGGGRWRAVRCGRCRDVRPVYGRSVRL